MSDDPALKKARYMVLRFLTYRARSEKEVSDYLQRKGFAANITETIIKEMHDYGYINDERYVTDFINYRKTSGFGLIRVRFELQSKGVSGSLIDSKISELYNADEDLETVKSMLARKAAKTTTPIDNQWARRQSAFLKRRGFRDSLIMIALQDYLM